MSSFACESIHLGLDPKRCSDEFRGRSKIFIVLDCSIWRFANKWRCEDIGQIFPHGEIFRCAFRSIKVPGKILLIRLRLQRLRYHMWRYCAFQKHANSEVQKPPSKNLETEKHTKRIDIHQSQITNHDLWSPLK